ncbi:hypothetical protein PALU110988_21615 [Paenibacillus lupini]|nr:hypothetical protein [Paenibacillus lupini]
MLDNIQRKGGIKKPKKELPLIATPFFINLKGRIRVQQPKGVFK